jgi:hypothetical protein
VCSSIRRVSYLKLYKTILAVFFNKHTEFVCWNNHLLLTKTAFNFLWLLYNLPSPYPNSSSTCICRCNCLNNWNLGISKTVLPLSLHITENTLHSHWIINSWILFRGIIAVYPEIDMKITPALCWKSDTFLHIKAYGTFTNSCIWKCWEPTHFQNPISLLGISGRLCLVRSTVNLEWPFVY